MEPIHQKYKAYENTSRHNLKKNTKANNQLKSDKDPMQRNKLASDGGALALMCGRDDEPQPSEIACWRILVAYAHYRATNMRCW